MVGFCSNTFAIYLLRVSQALNVTINFTIKLLYISIIIVIVISPLCDFNGIQTIVGRA